MHNENLKLRTKRFGLNSSKATSAQIKPWRQGAGQRHLNSMVFELRFSLTPRLQSGVLGDEETSAVLTAYHRARKAVETAESQVSEPPHRAEAAVLMRELDGSDAFPLQEANEFVAIIVASINTTNKSSRKAQTTASPIPHSALRTPN